MKNIILIGAGGHCKSCIEVIELQKKYILDEKSDYEELLQQNRYHLKELSIQSREKDEQLKKYEDIIQKLSASHPFMK